MKPVKITEGIYCLPAIDWNIRDFHGYATEQGTTYNAYLIVDEKITLVDTVKKENANTLVIAVTVLTSMTDQVLRETLGRGADCNAAGHVAHLAKFAEFAGMHGVVASAHEIQIVKKCCGSSFILVVPGIRPAFAEKNDQKRIMTPREASENGADFIVVGRPVTDAPVPSEAAKMILEEIFPPVRI